MKAFAVFNSFIVRSHVNDLKVDYMDIGIDYSICAM